MKKKWLAVIVIPLCIVTFFGVTKYGLDPSLIGYDYCVATGNHVLVWYDEMGGRWSECQTSDEKAFVVDCNKFPRRCS